MLFSFDKLIAECIHNPFLTNCLASKKLRSAFSFTSKIFKEYSAYTFQEIKEIDQHFHYVNEKDKKNLINKVLKKIWSKKMLRWISNPDIELCQMSLDNEEGRMVGILEKINNSQKHPERNFLFSPLFYDFEHSFHPNLRKKKDISKLDLICIMAEKNCSAY